MPVLDWLLQCRPVSPSVAGSFARSCILYSGYTPTTNLVRHITTRSGRPCIKHLSPGKASCSFQASCFGRAANQAIRREYIQARGLQGLWRCNPNSVCISQFIRRIHESYLALILTGPSRTTTCSRSAKTAGGTFSEICISISRRRSLECESFDKIVGRNGQQAYALFCCTRTVLPDST